MNLKRFIVIMFAVLLTFSNTGYAAFPVKNAPAQQSAAKSAVATSSTVAVKKQGLVAKAKRLVHLPIKTPGGQENSSLFSVLSFVFSLVGIAMIPLSLLMAIFGAGAAIAMFFLAVALTVAALVLGITALVKHQRLRGLAIAGIVISAYTLIEILFAIALIIALV